MFKKLHYSSLILRYQNNIKKTSEVIKESIGKTNPNQQIFPKKIIINKESITDSELIAKHFNTVFTEIGPNHARNIEKPSETSFRKTLTTQPENPLTINK